MNPNAAHEPIIKIENLYKKYGDNVVLEDLT
jgi:ABC-type transporter Mla maintaining outer membrane lipid asymmetry ATPase subunit MlaF